MNFGRAVDTGEESQKWEVFSLKSIWNKEKYTW